MNLDRLTLTEETLVRESRVLAEVTLRVFASHMQSYGARIFDRPGGYVGCLE
jgi:hypothetical protein